MRAAGGMQKAPAPPALMEKMPSVWRVLEAPPRIERGGGSWASGRKVSVEA